MSAMNTQANARYRALFTRELFKEVTRLRVKNPERLFALARGRRRRESLSLDSKLNIIAVDHPARGVVEAGNDSSAMSNRRELLTRVAEILLADSADGVMATMDILEELFILADILRGSAGSFLDNKVVIVSLNRGGLAGSTWELDDPVTGASPEQAVSWNLDGIKLLLRICNSDAGSLKTMMYCSEMISRANASALPTFLEPLPVVQTGAVIKVDKSAEALAKIVGIATALGDSSRYLWLKLPVCPEFQKVANATTCPILALGGETVDTKQFLSELEKAMSAADNVLGAMVGRNVLFPDKGDSLTAARKVHDLVHRSPT